MIIKSFNKTLRENNLDIKRNTIETIQINIGNLCNQACHHCHVEAGPKRKENIKKETIDRILELLKKSKNINTVDITGGAPELNPGFRYLVDNLHKMGKNIIDRCNLTVLFEKNQEDTAQFLCDNQVEIIASLPCYSEDNVDKQRGKGVFNKSIEALKILNNLGYGKKDSSLVLNLVYNPGGAFLPSSQEKLEVDYKTKLQSEFGIVFNRLFTITNMPLKRYAHYLRREKLLEEYMNLLIDNFNPEAAKCVMCTNMLSISWDGTIYNCDFNHILKTPADSENIDIWSINDFSDVINEIEFNTHCYGCAAGAGSSCGGALAA